MASLYAGFKKTHSIKIIIDFHAEIVLIFIYSYK